MTPEARNIILQHDVVVRDDPLYMALPFKSLNHYRKSVSNTLNHIRDLNPASPAYQNLVQLYKTGLLVTDDAELVSASFPVGKEYRDATTARFARIQELLERANQPILIDFGFPEKPDMNPEYFLRSRARRNHTCSWTTGIVYPQIEFVNYSDAFSTPKQTEPAPNSFVCSMRVKEGHMIILERGALEDAPADAFFALADDEGHLHPPFHHLAPSKVYQSSLSTLIKTDKDKGDYLRVINDLLIRADRDKIESVALLAIGSVHIIDKVIKPFLLRSRSIHRVYLVTNTPRMWMRFKTAMGCDKPTVEQESAVEHHIFKFLSTYKKA